MGNRQYPHNVLLEVGAEGGVLALFGLTTVIALAVRKQAHAASAPVEMAMLALVFFFLLNAMVSGDINDNRGLWVALGAALISPLPGVQSGKSVDQRLGGGVDEQ
jgi:hypothetical protein